MPATKAKARRSVQISEIREKAESRGIVPGNMKKAELIHAIQAAEGCTQCFGRSNGQCAYTDCCFMQDCLKTRL
ncbi:MAG TPA: Rho termination factor N-terminal domain-containing protein [Sedimentisphaerales bacterium]|nr:Rho termination factor N-terminal domain-containing protein [Sedimentisphaerales bacterium]